MSSDFDTCTFTWDQLCKIKLPELSDVGPARKWPGEVSIARPANCSKGAKLGSFAHSHSTAWFAPTMLATCSNYAHCTRCITSTTAQQLFSTTAVDHKQETEPMLGEEVGGLAGQSGGTGA